MDYQEAIELLKGEIKCSCYRNRGYCGICTIYSELDRDKIIDACKCAISAIQELQEYQKIGTLEEMKMLKATHFSGIELAKISCRLKQLEKYVDIGTLEEVRDAVEKQRAKKPKNVETEGYRYTDTYRCPTCGGNFSGTGIADYCYHCGQKLNWSEVEE